MRLQRKKPQKNKMVTLVMQKCPKCGSTNMKWVHKGDNGYYLCAACGYAGFHTHEEQHEDGELISP
jgi:ribosomal protein S27AE